MRILPLAVLLLVPPSFAQERSGWFDLFDGESLAGWVTKGGRYDGKAIWTVENGAIVGKVGPGKAGGLIYTDRDWHSFELRLETRIDWPFDSGVFVRMTPGAKGAQLTLDWRPGGEIGGVYSDGWLEHCPGGAEHFRKGEWNDVWVRCTGRDFRLQMRVNGEPLTDFRLPEDAEGYAATGKIGLQVHGGLEPEGHTAQFRAVRMRELPVFDLDEFECDDGGMLHAKEGSGWTPLLADGLDAWRGGGEGSGFALDADVLVVRRDGSESMLWTEEEFGDFELRLDFRTVRGANSGVFLRRATEVQILDDFHWEQDTGTELEPWQLTGSLYAAVPPGDVGALYPIGRWNSLRVVCEGSRMRCELNGVELWDVDTAGLEVHKHAPFAERPAVGPIGLQRHAPARNEGEDAGQVFFKNVFVRPLPR